MHHKEYHNQTKAENAENLIEPCFPQTELEMLSFAVGVSIYLEIGIMLCLLYGFIL